MSGQVAHLSSGHFYVLVVFVCLMVSEKQASGAALHPCRNYQLMELADRGRRHPNFAHSMSFPNICDYDIDESVWYSFTTAVSYRMPEYCVPPLRCGTNSPVWMNGTHPTAASPGPVTTQVCATAVNGDCCGEWSGEIQVVYCPAINDTDDFYVYKLLRAVSCDSAYCAVNRSDVEQPSNDDSLTTGAFMSTVATVSPVTFSSESHHMQTSRMPSTDDASGVTTLVQGTGAANSTVESNDLMIQNITAPWSVPTVPTKPPVLGGRGISPTLIVVCVVAACFLLTCVIAVASCSCYCRRRKKVAKASRESSEGEYETPVDNDINGQYYCKVQRGSLADKQDYLEMAFT